MLKEDARLVAGKGNKYYPKELIDHLRMADMDCQACKEKLATNYAIQINILNNGGQYSPGGLIRRTTKRN